MAPSAKGKEKVIYSKDKGKRKRNLDDGKDDGRKRRNRAVLQFIDDAAYQVDEDESSDDDSFFDDDFVDEEFDNHVEVPIEPAKPPNPAGAPKEELMSEEDFDKMMERRYKPGSGFVSYEEDKYESKKPVEVSSYLPTAMDPVIWKVKCTVGRERHSAFCLMQKYTDLKYLGTKLHILSAFALDHVKGFVYIEAEKPSYIYEACNGICSIYSSRAALVPKDDISHLFSVRSKGNGVSEGMWARVKNGKYRGDLAQVVAVNDMRKKVTVKLIPRIDLRALADKFGRGATIDKSINPAPRLISASELEEFRPLIQYRRDRDSNKVFEVLDGMLLKDGYLYKKVSVDSLSFWGVTPTEEELLKFEPSTVDESKDAEWLTQLYGERKKKKRQPIFCGKGSGKGEGSSSTSMENKFEVHDLVFFGKKEFGVIIGSEKDDTFKIIKDGLEVPVTVTLLSNELRIADFDKKLFTALDQHGKTISINDTVRVFDGPLKDIEGVVKRIYRGIVFLYNELAEENSGYTCVKAQMCEKLETSVGLFSGKGGGVPGISSFEDHSSPKSPLSPQIRQQEKEGSYNFSKDDNAMYSIGQSLRIRVGPLKGYLCRVLAIRRSDVTVKLDSKHKIITVKCEHLSEVRGRSSGIALGGDSDPVKPFELPKEQDGSRDWADGAATAVEGGSWNAGGVSTERGSSWPAFPATNLSVQVESSKSVEEAAEQGDSWGAKKAAPVEGPSWGAAADAQGTASKFEEVAGWGSQKNAGQPESNSWNKATTADQSHNDSWGNVKKNDEGSKPWGKGASDIDGQSGGWSKTTGSTGGGFPLNDQEGGNLSRPGGEGSSWSKPGGGSSSWSKPDGGSSSWKKPTGGSPSTERLSTVWESKSSGGQSPQVDPSSGWSGNSSAGKDFDIAVKSNWNSQTTNQKNISSWGDKSANDKIKGGGDGDVWGSKKGSSSAWGQSSGAETSNSNQDSWARKSYDSQNTFNSSEEQSFSYGDRGRGGGRRGGRGGRFESGRGRFGGGRMDTEGVGGSWSGNKSEEGGSSSGWGQSKGSSTTAHGNQDSWGPKRNLNSEDDFGRNEGNDGGGAWNSKKLDGGSSSGWGNKSGGTSNNDGHQGSWGNKGNVEVGLSSGWSQNRQGGATDAGGSGDTWGKKSNVDEDSSSRWGQMNSGGTTDGGGSADAWGKKSYGNQGSSSGWGQGTADGGGGEDKWGKKSNTEGGMSSGWGQSKWGGTTDSVGGEDTWGKKNSWNSGPENSLGGNEEQTNSYDDDGGRGGNWRGGRGGRRGSDRGRFGGRGGSDRGGFGGRGRGGSEQGGFGGRDGQDRGGFGGRSGSDRGGFGGRGRSEQGGFGGRDGSDRGDFRGRGGFRGRGRGRTDDFSNRNDSGEDKPYSWNSTAGNSTNWSSDNGGGSWGQKDNDKGKWQSGSSGWKSSQETSGDGVNTQVGQWNQGSGSSQDGGSDAKSSWGNVGWNKATVDDKASGWKSASESKAKGWAGDSSGGNWNHGDKGKNLAQGASSDWNQSKGPATGSGVSSQSAGWNKGPDLGKADAGTTANASGPNPEKSWNASNSGAGGTSSAWGQQADGEGAGSDAGWGKAAANSWNKPGGGSGKGGW